MRPFTRLEAVAAPIDLPNVDTDRIVPARFLRKPKNPEYARYLFHDVRFAADGSERPEFVLNHPAFRDAEVLIAAENFGCGSSREMAVWALDAYGVRAVIAPSLGDIFHQNCFKNGLLPVILGADAAAGLRRQLHARPGARITVDLEAQAVVAPDGETHHFEIDPFRKDLLLTGRRDRADPRLRAGHPGVRGAADGRDGLAVRRRVMPAKRERIQPKALHVRTIGGRTLYSHVVAVEGRRLIFVAGQLARDRDGKVVGPGDMRAQIRQVGENLKAALAAAGATMQHVVKTTTFVTDIEAFFRHADERIALFGDEPPTSTTVEVRRLAGPEFLIEIEAIAVV